MDLFARNPFASPLVRELCREVFGYSVAIADRDEVSEDDSFGEVWIEADESELVVVEW
ncbi:MAG TPA: hypothetical protein VGI39_24370 [Polyangiaceae bacterium]|jgi:hypothetical protein